MLFESVGREREQMGAVMNRLDHTIANLNTCRNKLGLAKGRIEDADFAAETSNLAEHKFYNRHRWQC